DQLCETFEGYTLDVENGYGDGIIEEGKTVHVWAEEREGMVFSHWSGDTERLESSIEYHTTLTMPAENVHINANYSNLLPDMEFEALTIPGAERNKKIYTYFPTKDKIKGVVWLFHGTNGNAVAWVNEIENRQLSNRLMASDYGIVAITSEESEFEIDFNNDGNFRWSYGVDSSLIDFANIRAVRDALLAGGKFNSNTPHTALGFSAGGAFTEFVAVVLKWRAAVNHNAKGNLILSENSTVPYFHSISENDNHPDVGLAGNQEARDHYQNYLDRDACVNFEEFLQMPLFAERFARSPLISKTLSAAIFNEIKTNNGLDEADYIKGLYNDLEQVVLNNISNFPVIASLTGGQRNHVKDQIQTTNAEHHFKSDFNGRTLEFIQTVCNTTGTDDHFADTKESIQITPNPAMDFITINAEGPIRIYDTAGRLRNECNDSGQDISTYQPGLYIVKTNKGFGRFVKM
ncbi:MAG: T9SS type A sorting domain-containing protein, partial [Saprospiraceae bacterium]|nr:T9SS type A sorting domain-containing protein [Saprospiraceae bacterium]